MKNEKKQFDNKKLKTTMQKIVFPFEDGTLRLNLEHSALRIFID